jgi:soluble lytic murein transglycosylase-like protein
LTYPFEKEIAAAAKRHGLDPCLVAAVCYVESSFMPDALRYERKFQDRYIDLHPNYCFLPDNLRCLLASSLGLMQVMGLTATELGLSLHHIDDLQEPEVGLEYGCRVLADKIKKYAVSRTRSIDLTGLEPAVAAYNSGTPRKGPKGNWVNYKYVLKVMKKYQEYSRAQGTGLKAQG